MSTSCLEAGKRRAGIAENGHRARAVGACQVGVCNQPGSQAPASSTGPGLQPPGQLRAEEEENGLALGCF